MTEIKIQIGNQIFEIPETITRKGYAFCPRAGLIFFNDSESVDLASRMCRSAFSLLNDEKNTIDQPNKNPCYDENEFLDITEVLYPEQDAHRGAP